MRGVPNRMALGAVAIVLSLLATGCRKSGEERLEGHWRGTKVEGVSGEEEAAATSFALGMEMHFHGGLVSVKTPREKTSSSFKVVSEDKTTVVVVSGQDGAKDPQTFVFADEDTMRWSIVEGKRIILRREK